MLRAGVQVRSHREYTILSGLLVLPILLAAGCTAPLLPDPAVRYIAFGDSTTASRATVQYWQYVRQDLGLPANAFAGQGHDGETAAEGLPRLRDLLDKGLYPNAQVLLYWEGGNDILKFVKNHDPLVVQSPTDPNYPFQADLNLALDQVQADIEQAVTLANQKNLKLCAATYFDLVPGECKAAPLNLLLPEQVQQANQYVRLLNDRIRQAAANTGATLVEVASQAPRLANDPANYTNCNHLSNQGNRIVADMFVQTIQATGQ